MAASVGLKLAGCRALAGLPGPPGGGEGGGAGAGGGRGGAGTGALREENEVVVVELAGGGGAGALRQTHALAHPEAVWGLAPDPVGAGLLLSAHHGPEGWGASLWELDLEGAGRLRPRGSLGGYRQEPVERPLKLAWAPEGTSALAVTAGALEVWDLADGEARRAQGVGRPRGVAPLGACRGGSAAFTAGAWDPYDPKLACAAQGSALGVWDLRGSASGGPAQALGASARGARGGHFMQVRDVDYCRAATGLLATCGDDCRLCVWDLRRPEAPVACREAHSHWLWCARFHPLHPALLLTASSDTDVRLWSLPGLKRPGTEPPRSPGAGGAGGGGGAGGAGGAGDATTFDEHEESVYSVAWSEADPWAFASLSHDGRLVCSRVPDSTKYEMMHV